MNLNFGQGHHFQSSPEKYGEIGKLIDEKLTERGISKSKFAKEMEMSPFYLAHIPERVRSGNGKPWSEGDPICG